MAIALTESLNNVVWIDPNGQNGEPCFYGTPVAVKVLFDHLKGGHTLEDFLAGFPPSHASKPKSSWMFLKAHFMNLRLS
ncbi:MAG: DUF433 domain-containing protein [Blastocatellia bacterium]